MFEGQRLTTDERERELGGSVFGIKDAFNTFSRRPASLGQKRLSVFSIMPLDVILS